MSAQLERQPDSRCAGSARLGSARRTGAEWQALGGPERERRLCVRQRKCLCPEVSRQIPAAAADQTAGRTQQPHASRAKLVAPARDCIGLGLGRPNHNPNPNSSHNLNSNQNLNLNPVRQAERATAVVQVLRPECAGGRPIGARPAHLVAAEMRAEGRIPGKFRAKVSLLAARRAGWPSSAPLPAAGQECAHFLANLCAETCFACCANPLASVGRRRNHERRPLLLAPNSWPKSGRMGAIWWPLLLLLLPLLLLPVPLVLHELLLLPPPPLLALRAGSR